MHLNAGAPVIAVVLHALLMSAATLAQTAADKRCSVSNAQQFKPMYDPMPGKMPYMPMYYPMPGKDAYPNMFTPPMFNSMPGKDGYSDMFTPMNNPDMPKEKVSVHVFYTTFCMDSQNLIMNQIAPGWPKYEAKADIEFIPWGKSMSTMDGGFRCQHGPEECRQNMIDSCVLSNLGKGAKQLQYVACRMQMPAFDDHVQKCAELQQVSWSDVVSCTTSGMGKDLQLEAERMTRQMTPGPRFVPTVVFNKVYNDLYQMEVERGGFDKVMCMDLQAC